MLGALRVVSVERGIDPRELMLVPFGGAGPVHGAQLARLAGISTVLVPALPGCSRLWDSCWPTCGRSFPKTLVGSSVRSMSTRTTRRSRGSSPPPPLARSGAYSSRGSAIEVHFDLRYTGQAYELPDRDRRDPRANLAARGRRRPSMTNISGATATISRLPMSRSSPSGDRDRHRAERRSSPRLPLEGPGCRAARSPRRARSISMARGRRRSALTARQLAAGQPIQPARRWCGEQSIAPP